MQYCFYLDWAGWSPEVWAAWAQAILSALAIVVAARMAINQERRTLRRRIEIYVGMISDADDEANQLFSFLDRGMQFSISKNTVKEWESLALVFDSVPFHDVPDYRLYGLIRDASRCVSGIRNIVVTLSSQEIQIFSNSTSQVRQHSQTLSGCHEEAIDISNELRGLNIRGCVKITWYKSKNWLKRNYKTRKVRLSLWWHRLWL